MISQQSGTETSRLWRSKLALFHFPPYLFSSPSSSLLPRLPLVLQPLRPASALDSIGSRTLTKGDARKRIFSVEVSTIMLHFSPTRLLSAAVARVSPTSREFKALPQRLDWSPPPSTPPSGRSSDYGGHEDESGTSNGRRATTLLALGVIMYFLGTAARPLSNAIPTAIRPNRPYDESDTARSVFFLLPRDDEEIDLRSKLTR